MITDPESIKQQYEGARLNRYSGIKRNIWYSPEDFLFAYELWANHPYGREHLWDEYCDVRDGVPRGTNTHIRRDRIRTRWVN